MSWMCLRATSQLNDGFFSRNIPNAYILTNVEGWFSMKKEVPSQSTFSSAAPYSDMQQEYEPNSVVYNTPPYLLHTLFYQTAHIYPDWESRPS